MKKTQSLVICTFIIILCAVFSGCGSDDATKLQKIVDQNRDKFLAEGKTDGGNLDFFVRDSALVYSFKFIGITKGDIDPALLADAIEANSSMFQALLSEMKLVGIKSPGVVIEYLDLNGEIIYSKEFK